MRRFYNATWVLALMLLIASCDKQKQTVAIPKAEASMERIFDFKGNDPENGANYTLTPAEVYFTMEKNRFEVAFAPAQPAGKDAISFKIMKTDLAHDFIGKYQVKSLPNPAAGLAEIVYYHYLATGAGSMLLSGANTMDGYFEITAYSAAHKTVSGRYEVKMPDALDPTRPTTNLADAKKCDITVRGSFQHVKLVYL